MARAPQTLQIPATAQAMLAARIDRLAPDDKRLIQTASVIGKDVPFTLLQAIAEGSEEALRHGLTNLQAAEFLYEARLFPDLEYTFKHALTHDVAYGSLLHERRRTLHARIVEAIEALSPDRSAENVERLAHHAIRGEMWEKALTYCREAGAKAAARSAHQEALACFEQSLAALEHLPTDRSTLERAIDLRLEVRNSLVALGEGAPVLEHLRHAEALAETLGDDRRRSTVAFAIAHASWLTGDHGRAVKAGQRALDLAINLADSSPRIMACFVLGEARYSLGEYEESVAWMRKVLDLLRGDLSHHHTGYTVVTTRRWLVQALAELGEFDQATTFGEAGRQLAQALDHPYSLVSILFGVGHLFTRQGDFQRAIPVLEQSLELSRSLNFQRFVLILEPLLALSYAHAGRHTEAVTVAKRAPPLSPLAASHMGETHLLVGHLVEAKECATRALGLARQRKERGSEAWALHLLGGISSRRDVPDAEQAEVDYRDALALAQELKMRPLIAHCHLGLGHLYRRTGKGEQAQEHLTTATAKYREMGLRFWLEQAGAESAAP